MAPIACAPRSAARRQAYSTPDRGTTGTIASAWARPAHFPPGDSSDATAATSTLPFLESAELIQAAPSTATFLVERHGRVKVSFFGGLSLGRVGDVSVCEDTTVRVASLLDLAAQKVRVVQVRAERKDYLDLMTLLQHGIRLPHALGAARALYPDFAPLVSLKALSYFGDGDLERLPAETKRALSEAAAGVRTIDEVPLLSEQLN